jgi:hypothetical protein
MSIAAAWAWYLDAMARLGAIDAWIRAGKPDPYEAKAADEGSAGVELTALNKALRPFFGAYAQLGKPKALDRYKTEHEDVRRIALVRLFAGFEADFQRSFAKRLKAAWDAIDGAGGPKRSEAAVLEVLPNSIELCLALFQRLDPRFSSSERRAGSTRSAGGGTT